MKKAALLTITAVLLALCVPVFAQEFVDVPTDHWAYQAVQQLADAGVVVGYPDGTFGGKRALTRYEFAQALARTMDALREAAGGPAVDTSKFATKDELNALTNRVNAIQPTSTAGFATVEQLNTLQRLVDEFRTELTNLGVNVDTMKRDIAALNDRLTAVEAEQARVVVTGNVNFIGRGTVDNSGTPFDKDSRSLVGTKNLLENSSFFNDFDLGIKGRVSDNTSVTALINTGNYLSDFIFPGDVDDFTLWNLYVDAGMDLGPLGAAQFRGGRFPFQLTPLTLKFVDPDSYTYESKLDNGDFVLDGASLGFNVGGVALSTFAAKAQPIADLISPDLLLNGVGGIEVSQLAGARAVIGTPFAGNLGLTYYEAGLGGVAGRTQIMGADLNATVSGIGVGGEFAQTKPNDTMIASTGVADDNNTAWNAKLNYSFGKLGVGAGYSVVEQNYYAPGYWSDLGRAVNLVNVKGVNADLTYNLSPRISFTADGKFLEPDDDGAAVSARTNTEQGRVVSVAGVGLDKITYWKAGLKYSLTSANSVDLGWEQVNWEPVTGSDTEERYITVGVGHAFNPNSSLKLLYQIVEYEQGAAAVTPYGIPGDYRGGVATAQFQLKF